MPAQIVTQVMVNEAAEALVAAGQEPTIRTVQARLGAGSYTTVKNYLELWRKQRPAEQPAVEVPEAIAAKSAELGRALWGAAAALAEQQTQQAREEAQGQVAQAQAALAEAEQTIARMESEAEEQAQLSAGQAQAIAQLRTELAETRSAAQIAEARAAALEQQVGDLRTELAQAHAQALVHAQQAGELAALRQQVQQQAELIERLAARQAGGPQE